MTIQGVSVQVPENDYSAKCAIDLIKFIESAKGICNEKSRKEYVLIEFRNTKVLYCEAGYRDIEADCEYIEYGDYSYIVSCDEFLQAESLSPLQLLPFEVPLPHVPKISADAPNVHVIVPIYGSLRHTWEICGEIESFLPELRNLGGKVTISVDGHPTYDQVKKHLDLIQGLDRDIVEIYDHSENLGFIGNVNFMFTKTSIDEIVVLLTTDVKMEPNTLTRLCQPLIEQDNIALATPYAIGGENLEAPESSILNWRDLDRVLGGTVAKYPDAETNVGYLLAVDRRKYHGEELFDNFFENGYGDDSDLYYRCVNMGYRGVLVDNCCVLHEHGASFAHTQNRTALRSINYRRFMERWGEAHFRRHAAAASVIEQRKQAQSGIASALNLNLPAPQIIFLLPTNDRRYGGVAAVFNIVEGLCDSGISAAVICANKPVEEHNVALKSVLAGSSQSAALLARADWVVATAHDTCPEVKRLAAQYNCRTGYFIQGPEFSFSDGNFLRSVVTGYSGFDAIFTVSDYLKDVVETWVRVPIHVVPYGPHYYSYFETNTPREERSIAIQLNGNPNKGSAYVAGVVAALAGHGYKFYSFGDEALRDTRRNLCKHLGFLSTSEKISLFNTVEFYLDASNFEGLGLLLMESVHCGAIPIYRHNGGTADLLKAAQAGIEVGDYAAIGKIHHQLEEFRQQDLWTKQRALCRQAIGAHSREAAVAAMKEWWDAL